MSLQDLLYQLRRYPACAAGCQDNAGLRHGPGSGGGSRNRIVIRKRLGSQLSLNAEYLARAAVLQELLDGSELPRQIARIGMKRDDAGVRQFTDQGLAKTANQAGFWMGAPVAANAIERKMRQAELVGFDGAIALLRDGQERREQRSLRFVRRRQDAIGWNIRPIGRDDNCVSLGGEFRDLTL